MRTWSLSAEHRPPTNDGITAGFFHILLECGADAFDSCNFSDSWKLSANGRSYLLLLRASSESNHPP